MIALLALASACAPAPATYEKGPGYFGYTLDQGGTTIDSGGGLVHFVLTNTSSSFSGSDPFCFNEGSTGFWKGAMTTDAGFEGTAGEWRISIGYRTGYLGFCGPAVVTLTDPDEVVQLDGVELHPVGFGTPACDDVMGTQLEGTAPLASDPSVTAMVSILICNQDVGRSFGSGF